MIMKKLCITIISALITILVLTLTITASEPWTYYDPDAAPTVISSVYKVRINEDCSLTVVFSARNTGETKAENYSLTKVEITFGAYTFDLSGKVTGKNIKAGAQKLYGVTIDSDNVPAALTDADLDNCAYVLSYEYAAGGYWQTGVLSVNAEKLYRW